MQPEQIQLGFYDTETTGLFKKGGTVEDPNAPHIMQLVLQVADGTGKVLTKFNKLIKPDFPPEALDPGALAAHGITYEQAMEEGEPKAKVIIQFLSLLGPLHLLVAHNKTYDDRMMDFEYWRVCKTKEFMHRKTTGFCTMHATTPIVKMPPTPKMRRYGFGPYKSPKMTEAYEFFFGRTFDKAHDAEADAGACREVFFELINRGHFKLDQLIAS